MTPGPLGGNTELSFYWLPAIYPLRPVGPHSDVTYGSRCTRGFHPPVHGDSSQGSPPHVGGGGASASEHSSVSTLAYARAITGEALGLPLLRSKLPSGHLLNTTHNTTHNKAKTTSQRCPQGWHPTTPSYQALFCSEDSTISDWLGIPADALDRSAETEG